MTVPSSSSLPRYCHPISASASLPDFTGHVLVVPVVSHACIPQLAVDLLINSPELKLQRVARLDATRDLIPFVGSDEGGNGGLTTSLEVYSDPSSKLTVIQQRSPVLKARKRPFSKRFTSWVRSQGFAQVLILSSVDNALRTEEEMNSQQSLFRHISVSSTSSSSTSSALLAQLSASVPELGHFPGKEGEKETPIPSSSTGITRRLLADLTSTIPSDETAAKTPTQLDVGVLLLFAAEGDNRPDAHYLAGAVAELLRGTGTGTQSKGQASSFRFAEPPSWAGLFGNSFDQALFG
ncbi:hypothetical protein BCV69DRAFT_281210 [Microstroma glucosiphilum]|uniref:Proteasome assembly chaperone 2 n=1 Tax=Pseudomicrostroma glucosiphilum TaxID=1684307 RepID=A0A316UAL2_9BASI|nr:hypothetical protein BCV69DRAFT_281210 [Pseudomicrostroma glucosiphilum]PWN22199.1 hypothetical protein BCV69DRAFT_281210 [Pseudomicrostroma glucosiphilum]